MDSNMASSFQSGSGIDPSAMKVTIMAITATLVILVFGWIVTRLYEALQDDHLSIGQFVFEVLLLLAMLLFMLMFLAMY